VERAAWPGKDVWGKLGGAARTLWFVEHAAQAEDIDGIAIVLGTGRSVPPANSTLSGRVVKRCTRPLFFPFLGSAQIGLNITRSLDMLSLSQHRARN
jgi:hypothetical protein